MTINVKTTINIPRAKIWTEDSGNISDDDGDGGFMFEDSKGNLWSAGSSTKLQVMYNDKYAVASVKAAIEVIAKVIKGGCYWGYSTR